MSLTEYRCPLLGTERHYACTDNAAPPLLLLHGVTRRWQCFLPVVDAFSLRFRVHALDFRGHGRSDRETNGYRVVDYVRDAVEFVRTVLREPAVIYGHSLGAMVAAATAAKLPDLVRGVVLEDPPFDTMGSRIDTTPLRGYFSALRRWAGSDRPIGEIARELAEVRMQTPGQPTSIRLGELREAAWFRFAARCLQRLDPTVLEPIVAGRWLEGYDVAEILPRIACPTLLLQADTSAGGMLIEDDARAAERLIPDCARVKFGCHHLIHWYDTRKLLNTTWEFLESL